MADTSQSLLERLRLADEPDDWERLVELYTPLIRSWLSTGKSAVRSSARVGEVS